MLLLAESKRGGAESAEDFAEFVRGVSDFLPLIYRFD